jgi:hypothetical protein
MIDTLSIYVRGSTLNPTVNNVALFKQELGKVGSVLASDTGDESYFF